MRGLRQRTVAPEKGKKIDELILAYYSLDTFMNNYLFEKSLKPA